MNCNGCGAKLQNTNENEAGFITKKTFDNHDLCKRCFRLIHHNETPDSHYTNEDFIKILTGIEKEDCLIIYLLDFFDFIGSNINEVEQLVKKKDHIIVANKIDLMPKAVKENKLKQWFLNEIKKREFNQLELLLISAKKKRNVDDLLVLIDKYRKNRNVYVIGATNTGKSTLINSIISAVTGTNKETITTSYYAGTTLSTIKIPFDDGTYLIDTPGIINEYQLTNHLSKKSLDVIIASNEIKPNTFQLNAEQVLFITGLVRMRFIKGMRTSFTLYFSNRISIHRAKLERENELVADHMTKDLLNPPTEDELLLIGEFETKKLIINKGKKDIVIEGFGWITINDINSQIEIEMVYPKKTRVHVRDSII